MLHTPSEVFHYTDSGGQSDAIHLSKSNTIFQAAKKDLLGIIQLQVGDRSHSVHISWYKCVRDYITSKQKQIVLLLVLHVVQCDTFCRKFPQQLYIRTAQFIFDVIIRYIFGIFFFFFWQDPTLLEGRVTLHHVKAGSVVARQGDQVRTTT